MAKLTEASTPSLINMLLLGFSGLGKSSSIIPLAIPEIVKGFPGYELRVLDADGKFEEVAREQLAWRLDQKKISPEQHAAALNNIDICVVREKTKVVSVGQDKRIGVVGQPTSWRTLVRQLESWQKDASEKQIIVVDSLTHIATISIPHFILALNGRLNQSLKWQEYGPCQSLVTELLTILADLPCNTIITGHPEPLAVKRLTGEKDDKGNEEEEIVESLMTAISIGSKGRVLIPAALNHVLAVAYSPARERRIYTQPEDGISTKTPFFSRAKKFYGLETGLAEYWQLAR
jgi:hypothetical protein